MKLKNNIYTDYNPNIVINIDRSNYNLNRYNDHVE